jgi:toxin-antitoxin system PIN domain toxin
MLLCDVNVLVYAHKRGAPRHEEYRGWLERLLSGDAAYGASDLVLSGFVRVVTLARLWDRPSTLAEALGFADAVRGQPHAVRVEPGERHWEIFVRFCRQAEARGNLVADAYLAALAVESGSDWITTDRDYARFAGLRWRHPLDPAG